jgi:hypothetical protein
MAFSDEVHMAKKLGRAAAVTAITIGAVALYKRPQQPPQKGKSLFWSLYQDLAHRIDESVGWDKLPPPLGLAVLVGLRRTLRERNLYDTNALPSSAATPVPPFDARYLTTRTIDGSYNDLDQPEMGMAGRRFGRNVPLPAAFPELEPAILDPNPRTVSRRLLTRTEFIPATTVNALVAAWLQFMIRDWFSHGKSPKDRPWKFTREPGDRAPEDVLTVLRLPPDPTRSDSGTTMPATYLNTETPWWDASQIYGVTREQQSQVRSYSGGKLRIDPDGLPPYPTDPSQNPALIPGFWLGLAMMHILFMREHNAICDRLQAQYPDWPDEEIFQRARLINAALIAKIHTVEWTPAVISHPTTEAALRANWWGLAGENLYRAFGRLSENEVISGIPGSETQHFDVPYTLTEEFTAVYRMHPLVPDDFSLRSRANDALIQNATLRDISNEGAISKIREIEMADLFYSFGTMHPGLVTLHNFPRFLQEFHRPDGHMMDLAATDIVRIRELGIPRYNEFRRFLGLKPAADFVSLTGNPQWARELQEVYRNDIERVDLMVGMFAERLPPGFAFSDTAFRIFILMASRRLNSDRFFTRDFRPEVYTPAGMEWISANNMSSVLLRHFPSLRSAMRPAPNAFTPWARARL